jgi:hypothetical protein
LFKPPAGRRHQGGIHDSKANSTSNSTVPAP